MSKPYRVTYLVEPCKLSREEVKDGWGAADALVIGSLIFPEEGGVSYQMATIDGRGPGPVGSDDVFKTWVFMAHELSQREDLSENKRELCEHVFRAVQDAILRARGLQ